MAVRELKQAARAVEWDEAATPEEKGLARKVRARAEEMLLNPPRPRRSRKAGGMPAAAVPLACERPDTAALARSHGLRNDTA